MYASAYHTILILSCCVGALVYKLHHKHQKRRSQVRNRSGSQASIASTVSTYTSASAPYPIPLSPVYQSLPATSALSQPIPVYTPRSVFAIVAPLTIPDPSNRKVSCRLPPVGTLFDIAGQVV
jgi:hypothetical protein